MYKCQAKIVKEIGLRLFAYCQACMNSVREGTWDGDGGDVQMCVGHHLMAVSCMVKNVCS